MTRKHIIHSVIYFFLAPLIFISEQSLGRISLHAQFSPNKITYGKAEQETIQGKFLYKLSGQGLNASLGVNISGFIVASSLHHEWLKFLCLSDPYKGSYIHMISQQLGLLLAYKLQTIPFQFWGEYLPYVLLKKEKSNSLDGAKHYGKGGLLGLSYSIFPHLALSLSYKQYYLIKSVALTGQEVEQNIFVQESSLGLSFFY